ncbi:MAG: hypothetical protein ACREDC_00160 [Bradyrhizobium sp.]
MLVEIEEGDIVIRITREALVFASENHPGVATFDSSLNDFRKVSITDPDKWRDEIVCILRRESESGETSIDRLLDNAVLEAVEWGAEGIRIQGVID